MKIKKKTILVFLIIGVILVTASILVYLKLKPPAVGEAIPESALPIQVRIIKPTSPGPSYPSNYEIPVLVASVGNGPISKTVLYVNGIPYKENLNEGDGADPNQFITQFKWQPGGVGEYLLTAQAIDENGENGISNAVLIEAGEAVGTRSQIKIDQGNTLEHIADAHQIDINEMQQANPGVDPKAALNSQDIIYIPNPPVSDPGSNSIPPLTPADSGEQASDSSSEELYDPEHSDLPYAPSIYMKYDGCEVKLRIENIGNFNDSNDPKMGELTREDGFYVYRSRDGGEFERIATFPARHDFGQSLDDFYEFKTEWSYIDSDQFGLLTYYITAFNHNGEKASAPVVIPLQKNNCTDPDHPSTFKFLRLDENGDLVSTFQLDTAYLYIQINDGQAVRVPEGNRFFLPDSGIRFNIYDYLDSVSSEIYLSDLKIHMEVWGWLAGELVHAGDIDQYIDRSVLSICSKEGQGSCSEDGTGEWVPEMAILANSIKPLNQQKYDIRWQITELTSAHKVCLGISMREFYGPGITDTSFKLFDSCDVQSSDGGYPSGNSGIITLDFSKLLYPEDPSKIKNTMKAGDPYQYPDFEADYPMGTPFTMYLRFVAGVDDYQFQDTSNTAVMHYQTQNIPPDLPPLASDIPSLFDIQILKDTYREPKYQIWEKTECVIVDHDPSGKYEDGEELCPLFYHKCGYNDDCEDNGFLDMLGAAWDLVVNLWEDAKGTVSKFISDAIPGCSGSDLCKEVVKKGVDYGITAITGIPPDIPNYEEVVSQGITESVISGLSGISGEDVSYVCGDYCKGVIASHIEPYITQAKSYYSQPFCYSSGGYYGMYPPCPDPSVEIHPSEGSADFPGFVMVRVTRKISPESLAAEDKINGKIKLHLTVDGENPSEAGLFYNRCKYQPPIPQSDLPDPSYPNGGGNANWDYNYLGDDGLAEPLFAPVDITIPWLEPGQSMDIPVKLQQITVGSSDCAVSNSRSQHLFFGGTSHMAALEYCYSSGSSWDWVPCTNGGQDRWDYENPISWLIGGLAP